MLWHEWSQRTTFGRESVFSFHHRGPEDWTHVVSRGGNPLYLLSCLASPRQTFFLKQHLVIKCISFWSSGGSSPYCGLEVGNATFASDRSHIHGSMVGLLLLLDPSVCLFVFQNHSIKIRSSSLPPRCLPMFRSFHLCSPRFPAQSGCVVHFFLKKDFTMEISDQFKRVGGHI